MTRLGEKGGRIGRPQSPVTCRVRERLAGKTSGLKALLPFKLEKYDEH